MNVQLPAYSFLTCPHKLGVIDIISIFDIARYKQIKFVEVKAAHSIPKVCFEFNVAWKIPQIIVKVLKKKKKEIDS